MSRRRSRTLGLSPSDHEKAAMRHYHSAEQLADKATASGCEGLNYYHSAALQYGQGLAHEQSGGGGFEVDARKKTASMAMTDAARTIRKCIRP